MEQRQAAGTAPTRFTRRQMLVLLGLGAGAEAGHGRDPRRGGGARQDGQLRDHRYQLARAALRAAVHGGAGKGLLPQRGHHHLQHRHLGGLPFGEVATTAAVQGFDAGAPLTIVGGGAQKVAEIYWVVLPDSPLRQITDLKGKTLGFTSPGSVTEGVANLCLKRAEGIEPQEVERRPMGGVREGLVALKGGGIDTAAHIEPVYSADKQKGQEFRILFKGSDYLQKFMQTVQVVGPGLLKDNPSMITGFLRARQRGVQFIRGNPEEAAQVYGRDAKLPPEVCLAAFRAVDPGTYYAVGLDREGLDLVQENLRILGLYREDQRVDWQAMVNQELLPDGVGKISLG